MLEATMVATVGHMQQISRTPTAGSGQGQRGKGWMQGMVLLRNGGSIPSSRKELRALFAKGKGRCSEVMQGLSCKQRVAASKTHGSVCAT